MWFLPPEIWIIIWEFEGYYSEKYLRCVRAIKYIGARSRQNMNYVSLPMRSFLARMYKTTYFKRGLPPVFRYLDNKVYSYLFFERSNFLSLS